MPKNNACNFLKIPHSILHPISTYKICTVNAPQYALTVFQIRNKSHVNYCNFFKDCKKIIKIKNNTRNIRVKFEGAYFQYGWADSTQIWNGKVPYSEGVCTEKNGEFPSSLNAHLSVAWPHWPYDTCLDV